VLMECLHGMAIARQGCHSDAFQVGPEDDLFSARGRVEKSQFVPTLVVDIGNRTFGGCGRAIADREIKRDRLPRPHRVRLPKCPRHSDPGKESQKSKDPTKCLPAKNRDSWHRQFLRPNSSLFMIPPFPAFW